MANRKKTDRVAEFGDFQTPMELASRACEFLSHHGFEPVSILEPTCGVGSFLLAALEHFPSVQTAVGVDINPDYVRTVKSSLQRVRNAGNARVIEGDFFNTDWFSVLEALPDPLLVIGNPPWVTNTELSSLGSTNLPPKANFKKHAGLDAITGKGNFDISEWMLLQVLHWLDGREATMAMLCKTGVARKVLQYAWSHQVELSTSEICLIDAKSSFGVSVDACLLVCRFSPRQRCRDARVRQHFNDKKRVAVIGYRDGRLLADVRAYQRWKHLQGENSIRWRSGIKHDCAKVMELRKEDDSYRNGLGELIELDDAYVYPMLKSSHVARGQVDAPARWMLVTQRYVGEDTRLIQGVSQGTWAYLLAHADRLDRRGSSIYRKRPPFSIFGVGDYSFAPWKVAISGLYKKLEFSVVGSYAGKPFVLDDTCYFLPCQTREQADAVAGLLDSSVAREFYSAFVFWDAKRPITAETLGRLNLVALAKELGREDAVSECLKFPPGTTSDATGSREIQLSLLDG